MSNDKSADSVHKRGADPQANTGHPHQTSGGIDPRGEHPTEPAEGAVNPGQGSKPGEHPTEPAEGAVNPGEGS